MKKLLIILAFALMLGCATTGNLPVENQATAPDTTETLIDIAEVAWYGFLSFLYLAP